MRESFKLDTIDLGTRVRQARAERKISQIELAELCGISVPYVSDIERGKKCISVDILYRLAQALQVSTDWLMRLDMPQTEYAYNSEAAEILADCTPDEALLVLDLMRSMKNILVKRRK